MLTRKIILCLLFVGLPSALLADVRPGDLPDNAKWYFHVDFEEMREGDAGQHLYRFLQDEVFEEVRSEAGVDLEKEADQITAFAAGDDTLIVVVDGNISQETQDMVLGMGAATGAMDQFESAGKDYYYVKNDEHQKDSDDGQESGYDRNSYNDEHHLNGLDAGAYFSFAVKNKVIVTSSESDMQAMLASKGKVPNVDVGTGTLLVLSADKSLVQAGLHTDEFAAEAGWDSNIINNTEQLALLIADEAGKIAASSAV